MNNDREPTPGDLLYEEYGVDRCAPLSDDERRIWLHNLYLKFLNEERRSAYPAFQALSGACQPAMRIEPADEDHVMVPWWAVKAILMGWQEYVQDECDLTDAWGLSGSQGTRPAKSTVEMSYRNRGIFIDLLTLLKEGNGITSAWKIVGERYSMGRDAVRKVWEQFVPEDKARFGKLIGKESDQSS